MVKVSSWGRLSREEHELEPLASRGRAGAAIAASRRPGLAFGMGRSYGDACLNPGGTLWTTRGLDRFIAFDRAAGRLACEAGVTLGEAQSLALGAGWMLPVVPGTRLATIGGAIANDVHGKNHHREGSFGDHVRRLVLARTDGERIVCGPHERPAWFAATVGGLGLTGVILEAEIALKRAPGPWLEAETIPYDDLDAFFDLADSSEAEWEHTVSWIDCARPGGRGLFMRANPIDPGPRPEPRPKARAFPVEPPVSLVNGPSLRAFNALYYGLNARRTGRRIVHHEPFFHPLDHMAEWNRIYGPRGFHQYQSVVPREAAPEAVKAMLDEIARAGTGSFLAVLKTFGERWPQGLLSFPRPGATLALDFPSQGPDTVRLFARLDAIVRTAGGRLYPAKDARMPRALFEAGYPRLEEFRAFRDPGISSALSRRLMGG